MPLRLKIELLIAVTVIGTLVSIVAVAVHKARTAAAKTSDL